ncbi:MAG: LruC domain-containing protein [Lentimicrobiaceae bacterium]|jgi:LruC domain-containing protein|nr:LruC domain-containing protein [Lentimicrobiaceae bacterium]
MNLKTITLLALSFFVISSLSSCKKDIRNNVNNSNPGEDAIFDFATKGQVNVSINYNTYNLVDDGNYQIRFSIYGENPFRYENGYQTKKANVKPLYSAWTNQNGRYQNTITLPLALTKVYLVSESYGAIDVAEVPVNNGTISFERTITSNTNKSTSAVNWTIPDTWHTLGGWDANGMPDYLIENKTFTTEFLESIQAMFDGEEETGIPESSIWYKHPEFFIAQGGTKTDMNLHLIKNTGITMSFISGLALYKSAVGYYVYKTDERPASAAEITDIYMVFPHISQSDDIETGNQVQLKFPDGNGGFVDEFPAGYSIGFALVINGFNNGNVNAGLGTIYSDHNNPITYGTEGQRTVALFEPGTNQMIALGFEDDPSYDKDYNDAIFNLFVEEPNAIDTDNMPPIDPPGEDPLTTSVVSGILLFEDLWPSKGDYDMNDVVVTYHSTIYRNKDNYIVKVEDVFTPIWRGCELINGFGYEMTNVATNQVETVEIDWGVHNTSTFMGNNQSEPGQSKQTYVFFENIKAIELDSAYKITTTFAANSVSDLQPPYNPFIFVNNPDPYVAPGNNGRNHEIHLTNFPPTDLGNTLPFGLADDKSNSDEDLYYISHLKYPFAIDLPYIKFRIVWEKVNVSDAYRFYDGWVDSRGEQNKDWYLYPTEGKVYDSKY